MNQTDIFQLRALLQQAQSILIAMPHSSDVDVVGPALAMYLVFTKLGKKVAVVSPDKVKVEMAHFFAIDKIGSAISGENNLVVSFPYQEGSIEKVSYHIDKNKFNLVIEPRGEGLNFNQQEVEFIHGTGDFDLLVVVGASDLSMLGTVYTQNQALFTQKPVVNIDKSETNSRFGKLNFVTKYTIAQFVTLLFKSLRIPLDQDAASNLLTGIEGNMGTLSLDSADPDMLESIAYLLRSKAQVLKAKHVAPRVSGRAVSKPKVQEEVQNIEDSKDTQSVQEQAPDDWFKPKIFTTNKSTTLV